MLDLEKTSKEHLQAVVDVKLYKRYQSFTSTTAENEVRIFLKPGGFFRVVKITSAPTFIEEIKNYNGWLQESEGEQDGTS